MSLSKEQIPYQTRQVGNELLIFKRSELVKTYSALLLGIERMKMSEKEFYLLYGFNWTPEGWVLDRALKEIKKQEAKKQ